MARFRAANRLPLRLKRAWFAARTWLTFQQALKLGAAVRKGERGELVVYYGEHHRKSEETPSPLAEAEEGEKLVRFLKHYTVFNTEQIEGLPEHYYAAPAPNAPKPLVERI